MAEKTISNPSVIVNNETIAIIPGSLVYDGGEVEINVRATSAGGQKTETVHSENAEDAVSMVKFKVPMKTDVDEKIADWKQNIAANSIQFVEKVGAQNAKRVFGGMSLVNKPERSTGPDGEAELEFKGDQMTG